MQDAFAARDVVELALSNCTFDPACPGVREWALWAVRNLCEGNEAVQNRIKSLQPNRQLQDEALRAAGERVVLDGQTGRYRLVHE